MFSYGLRSRGLPFSATEISDTCPEAFNIFFLAFYTLEFIVKVYLPLSKLFRPLVARQLHLLNKGFRVPISQQSRSATSGLVGAGSSWVMSGSFAVDHRTDEEF